MSVPKASVVCQLALAGALLVVAGVLWLALPRYQFVVLEDGRLIRGNLRDGAVAFCARFTEDRVTCRVRP